MTRCGGICAFGLPVDLIRVAGGAVLAGLAVYALATARGQGVVKLWRWTIAFPGWKITTAPTLLALALLAAALLIEVSAASAQALPKLPELPKDTLVEYPVPGAGGDLVVILSGDGGWADLDRQLGIRMAARGLSVLGFDCMKYFWQTRSPEETARDIDAVVEHYLSAWGKQRLVLIGYSFGAAVEPFVLARLPDALRAKLALAVLLGPATYANWEIHWGDWLHDQPHASARPVAAELAKIGGIRILCVYGALEAKGSLCPTLAKGTAELLELPGGHHFDEDYVKLADLILQRVP